MDERRKQNVELLDLAPITMLAIPGRDNTTRNSSNRCCNEGIAIDGRKPTSPCTSLFSNIVYPKSNEFDVRDYMRKDNEWKEIDDPTMYGFKNKTMYRPRIKNEEIATQSRKTKKECPSTSGPMERRKYLKSLMQLYTEGNLRTPSAAILLEKTGIITPRSKSVSQQLVA